MIEMDGIVAKMKNQKINYDRVLKKMIQQWERSEERPKILLHSCCAPCSTYVLEFLT
ncbi:DNA integration/recombination/inversion protein, partial [Staphylococcus pasteuri]